MRSFLIGLLVLSLVLLVAPSVASGCEKCQATAAVKTVQLPNFARPVRVVVLSDGTVVPRHPVVLGVRKVVRPPLVLVKRVVRPPLVLARRVVRVPFRLLGCGVSSQF